MGYMLNIFINNNTEFINISIIMQIEMIINNG